MTTTNLSRKSLDREQELAVRMMLHRLCCTPLDGSQPRNKSGLLPLVSHDERPALGVDGCDCLTREVVVYGGAK